MASLTFDQIKDPTDVRPYAFSFEEYLKDEITEAVDVLTECEITCADEAIIIDDPKVIGPHAVAIFSGGVAGKTYVIECVVKFESGKVLNRSAKLKVKEL